MAETFAKHIAKYRKPLEQLKDNWVPTDFLLAWIQRESNGQLGIVSKNLGERGLFQMHPDEKTFFKVPDTEWNQILTSRPVALKWGVHNAKAYAGYAKKELAAIGAEWHGRDFWKVVKLYHGAFSLPRASLKAFYRTNARPPADWNELMAFALAAAAQKVDLVPSNARLSQVLRGITTKVFNNAEATGGVLPAYNPAEVATVTAFLQQFGLSS
jgi:hypothetical protein